MFFEGTYSPIISDICCIWQEFIFAHFLFSVSHLALVLVNWYVCLMRVLLHPTHWTPACCSEPMRWQNAHTTSKVHYSLWPPPSSPRSTSLWHSYPPLTSPTSDSMPNLCLCTFLSPSDRLAYLFSFPFEEPAALHTNPSNHCNQASGQVDSSWANNNTHMLPKAAVQWCSFSRGRGLLLATLTSKPYSFCLFLILLSWTSIFNIQCYITHSYGNR